MNEWWEDTPEMVSFAPGRMAANVGEQASQYQHFFVQTEDGTLDNEVIAAVLLRMSSRVINSFDSCPECEHMFRHVESVHPRKGYNVLWESAESWKIKYKGCDTTFHVQR